MVCVTAAFCCPVVASSVDEINETLSVPLGIIVLKPPEQTRPINSLVEFPHSRHFIYDCRRCHHKWEGDTHKLILRNLKLSRSFRYSETRRGEGETGSLGQIF